MDIIERVANAYKAFSGVEKQENSLGNGSRAEFLRYTRNHKPLLQDWSQVEMSDQDMYTGYSYAAINKRANRASVLGKKFLYTEATPKLMEAAKEKGEPIEHPYLKLIKKSKEFSQRRFWNDISTYLDLEGIYYLMAVRAIGENSDGSTKVGEIQKFVMLNPYQVKRVRRKSDNSIGGYVESRDGMYREIPKEMIIEIRLLNPFDNDEPFSMTDAAKESQFTMKQAGDYTRHSIKGNINSPGIISTDVILDDHIFDNFISRIQNHEKGEPIYSNGTGGVNWQAMQIDLDKASLDKINEIHRSTLFAVSGVSKTAMGIEESGTGREVSKTQKDDFTENAVMPQVEDIIDALNLDYRKWYPQWEQDEYEILLDNPLESDREAELKDIEIRENELNLRDRLVEMGYEYEIASKYAHGEISLAELGEPTLEEELTDEEAEMIAMKEMGMDVPAEDQEPENGDQVEDLDSEKKANRVYATNKFVTKEENEKRLKEARKRVKERIKAEKEEARQIKQAEKEAKAKEREQKKEEREDAKKNPLKGDTVIEHPPVEDTKEEKDLSNNSIEDNLRMLNQTASREFPNLYDDIDIDMDKLGCIMLNTEKIPVMQYMKDKDDKVYNEGDHSGVAGEKEPHVTLLFGLMENGNTWKEKVDTVLEGWSVPTVTIEKVSYFDLGESYVIVGLVKKTPELVDGHERLGLLPHINTFSEWIPHISLVYINHDEDPEEWVKVLGKKYNGQKVATKDINYGDEPENDDTDDNHVEDEHDMSKTKKVKKDKDKNPKAEASQNSVEAPHSHVHHNHDNDINPAIEKAQNALGRETKDQVLLSENGLYTGSREIESDVAILVLQALREKDFNRAEELLTKAQKKTFVNRMESMLKTYFLVVYPIYANQIMQERAAEFDKQGVWSMTREAETAINQASSKGAESHINTVTNDLYLAIKEELNNQTEKKLVDLVTQKVNAREELYLKRLPINPNHEDIVKAVQSGKFTDDPIYKTAREQARQGEGLDAITSAVKKKYEGISRNRAKTIARHETNRVFNMAQYQADLQFLKEAGLMQNAYKVLRNRANDPCPVCAKLIEESNANPVPFEKNFADLGTELTATYVKTNGKVATQVIPVDYEAITAGNVHVNCRCEYDLVIKQDDGTFLNSIEHNASRGNPYRDKIGRFASGPGGASIESTNTASDATEANNKKLDKATSNKQVGNIVAKQREAVATYLEENGGDINAFKSIDENWVGNDYKVLENHLSKGDSKELQMVQDLQQTYFKRNGVTEVTVYRGVYGKQAKEIKAQLDAGKSVTIKGDVASSWTGYDSVARDYSDGAAFTAPDKIKDSVVIKQTFKVKDVVYSTEVAPFYAGNGKDEYIISSPKGFKVNASDIEVVK